MSGCEKRQGSQGLEITPAMVQAGARVLHSGFNLCGPYSAEGIAEEVFRAMAIAASDGDARPA
jgi:hypothetical protein